MGRVGRSGGGGAEGRDSDDTSVQYLLKNRVDVTCILFF